MENATRQRVVTVSLADLFWKSLRESEDAEGLFAFERSHRFAVAERQVNQYLSDADFRPLCELLKEEQAKLPAGTRALFLTGAFALDASVVAWLGISRRKPSARRSRPGPNPQGRSRRSCPVLV